MIVLPRQGIVLYLLVFFAFIVVTVPAFAAQQAKQESESGTKYIFYMHGTWIESHGLQKAHPRYGKYEYNDITKALSEKGFNVIGEVRSSTVDRMEYAKKIAAQAGKLMKKGVPQQNITIAGHSKGGFMTLAAATIVGKKNVNYVVLAGCGKKGTKYGKGFNRFAQHYASKLKGRILSIYDNDDEIAGTCMDMFTNKKNVMSKEMVLDTGKGHGLFYSPKAEWIDEIAIWAGM